MTPDEAGEWINSEYLRKFDRIIANYNLEPVRTLKDQEVVLFGFDGEIDKILTLAPGEAPPEILQLPRFQRVTQMLDESDVLSPPPIATYRRFGGFTYKRES